MSTFNIRREALRGVEERIFDLLSSSCTPRSWSSEFLSPMLEVAAEKGERDLAQKLVEAGASGLGRAMYHPIQNGHVDVVEMLLEHGAICPSALHVAAQAGQLEIALTLLRHGAEKDALCEQNHTPLIVAAQHGHVGVVEALLAAGADATLRGDIGGGMSMSALEIAAEEGHADVMRVILQHVVVDVDCCSSLSGTALQVAARNGNVDAIHLLVDAGANIHKREFMGRTPLHLAASRGRSVGAALALLQHGAIINAQDRDKRTPLHSAAACTTKQNGDTAAELVDLLLRWGADESMVDFAGRTAAQCVMGANPEGDPAGVARVRKLLADAPADRAWRRRGLLVLCRSHPDKVKLRQDDSGQLDVGGGDSQRPPGRAKVMVASGDGRWDWSSFMARVIGLQEEGVFRSIVRYL